MPAVPVSLFEPVWAHFAALPPELVGSINPQALASPEAAAALEAQLSALPNGAALFAHLMAAMRLALADATRQVFLVAAIVAAGGVVVALFLPEKPLRRRNEPILQEAADDITATGLAAPSPIPADAEPDLVGAPAPRARA